MKARGFGLGHFGNFAKHFAGTRKIESAVGHEFVNGLEHIMGAVDVGFTEAVVGAGVTGILFVLVLFRTSRETKD